MEQEDPIVHNDEVQEQAPEAVAEAPPARGSPAYNVARLRMEKEAAERRNQEYEREIERLRAAHYSQKAAPQEDEDDLLTVGQFKKRWESEKQALLRQQEEKYLHVRLKTAFPDFDDVVNQDSISELKYNDPQLAEALGGMTDPYSQGLAAYKMIKSQGYSAPKAVQSRAAPPLEAKKLAENAQKPRSIQSTPSTSPIGQANQFENGLTPELKAQIWAEMKQNMKRA